MPYYGWIIVAISILIIGCFLIGFVITFRTIKPKRRSLLETSMLEEEYSNGIMEFYQKNKTKEYRITSKYGYELQAYFFQNKETTNRYIVMSHGITYTHHGCLKYARMMLGLGFNVVLYDQPYHGNSGGRYSTLGYKEKDDLYNVITDTINRFGNDIVIGTYGESMGATTVLLEASIDPRVHYIFSDCGFSNLDVLMTELLKNIYKIPVFPFKWFSNQIFRIFVGVKYNGISPIMALKQINVPIFFAHGKSDNFIAYEHTLKMFESYEGQKKLFIGENESYHAGSYYKDTENYEIAVKKFIEEFHL